MHDYQFYVSRENFQKKFVYLKDNEFRHCCRVLRKNEGDIINVFDGTGNVYQVKIIELNKDSAKCEIEKQIEYDISENPEIILGVGLVKTKALDILITQAVSLGIREFYPIQSEHSIKQNFNKERYLKKSLESVKQSGGIIIPEIHDPVNFETWIEKTNDIEMKIIALQEDSKPISQVISFNKKIKKTAVVIGPEGGFSNNEINSAKQSGFIPINIFENRLRTELAVTSVIASIYALQRR